MAVLISKKYHSAGDCFVSHIRSLYIVVGVLTLLCIVFTAMLFYSMQTVRLSLPPTLEYGTKLVAGKIQPYEVYMFTGYIYQQLNTWRNNGQKDFNENIGRLQYFFSQEARSYLAKKSAVLNKKGELTNRTRYVLAAEAYRPELVETHSDRTWLVTLRYYLYEQIDDVKLKDGILLEVQLPVRYEDRDPEYNPWGLWLGAPLASPKRIRS